MNCVSDECLLWLHLAGRILRDYLGRKSPKWPIVSSGCKTLISNLKMQCLLLTLQLYQYLWFISRPDIVHMWPLLALVNYVYFCIIVYLCLLVIICFSYVRSLQCHTKCLAEKNFAEMTWFYVRWDINLTRSIWWCTVLLNGLLKCLPIQDCKLLSPYFTSSRLMPYLLFWSSNIRL